MFRKVSLEGLRQWERSGSGAEGRTEVLSTRLAEIAKDVVVWYHEAKKSTEKAGCWGENHDGAVDLKGKIVF